MLLEALVVYVPATPERDADISEFGRLSQKTEASFGEAACQAGDPDFAENDPPEAAIDAITAILHWLSYNGQGEDIERVLRCAKRHFDEETP